MLVDNLATTSLPAAFERTFDGKHPCPLCIAIAKGRSSEKKSNPLLPLKKIEGVTQAVVMVLSPPASFPPIARREAFVDALAHAPPTPPPRTV